MFVVECSVKRSNGHSFQLDDLMEKNSNHIVGYIRPSENYLQSKQQKDTEDLKSVVAAGERRNLGS